VKLASPGGAMCADLVIERDDLVPVVRAEEDEIARVRLPHESLDGAGDLVLFGAYDGYEIVSFDDQIGAHGSAGGSQLHPFLIGPRGLGLESAVLEDARDLHGALMSKYSR